jgi:hypothetical protein
MGQVTDFQGLEELNIALTNHNIVINRSHWLWKRTSSLLKEGLPTIEVARIIRTEAATKPWVLQNEL